MMLVATLFSDFIVVTEGIPPNTILKAYYLVINIVKFFILKC